MPASKSLKTLAAVASTEPIAPRSTSLARKRPNWWTGLNHPAGITTEPSGKRLYVSMGDIVGGDSHVAVIDLEKRAVIAQWPITGGPVPHTAGLDAPPTLLFVGSRLIAHTGDIGGGHQHEPGRLTVIDTDSGKVVQGLDSIGGADDLQYDAATGPIYFVGTTGTVGVFKE